MREESLERRGEKEGEVIFMSVRGSRRGIVSVTGQTNEEEDDEDDDEEEEEAEEDDEADLLLFFPLLVFFAIVAVAGAGNLLLTSSILLPNCCLASLFFTSLGTCNLTLLTSINIFSIQLTDSHSPRSFFGQGRGKRDLPIFLNREAVGGRQYKRRSRI